MKFTLLWIVLRFKILGNYIAAIKCGKFIGGVASCSDIKLIMTDAIYLSMKTITHSS